MAFDALFWLCVSSVSLLGCLILLFKNRAYHRELTSSLELLEHQEAERAQLTKELNHRVKNTLQLFQSFLSLERRNVDKQDSGSRLHRVLNARVRTLGLVSRDLYPSGHRHQQNLAELVARMTRLGGVVEVDDQLIELNLEPVLVDLDTANAFGLIFCEILLHCVGENTSAVSNEIYYTVDLAQQQDHAVFRLEARQPTWMAQPIDPLRETIIDDLVDQIDARWNVDTDAAKGLTTFELQLETPPPTPLSLAG